MKKALTSMLLGLFLAASTVASATPTAVGIKVNGVMLNPDVSPQIVENRTMVPLRVIAEALGATVTWDQATNSVIINSKASTATTLPTVDATKKIKIIVDGKIVKAQVPPQMMKGRTLVPIRVVAEALGAQVKWDGKNRIVVVESTTAKPTDDTTNGAVYGDDQTTVEATYDDDETTTEATYDNDQATVGTIDANALISCQLSDSKHVTVNFQNSKATDVNNVIIKVVAKNANGKQIATGTQTYTAVVKPNEQASLVVPLNKNVTDTTATFTVTITSTAIEG